MTDPKAKMWTGLVVSLVVVALALFLCAGTIRWWQAWSYLVITAASSVALTLQIVADPVLLENRTRYGPGAEQRDIQKLIVALAGIAAIGCFVVPGLDRRFGWSDVPGWLCAAGDILVLVSMWAVSRVFRENSFGAASVEIGKDQTVISTGPYAIVRNPMYSSAVLFFIGTALALGSYAALVSALLTMLAFIARLFDEENFLADNLPGYADYCARVRWHLIPGVF